MVTQRWLLDDLEPAEDGRRRVVLDDTGPEFAGCSVTVTRLRGGLSDGVDLIRLTTPRLELDIVPTRGMGVWRADVDGLRLAWASPVPGPVHPMWVDLSDPSGLGWLAGFDEFLVRCGLASNGAPEFDDAGDLRYPLHGRVANLPARGVALTVVPERGELAVSGEVDETRFGGKRLRLESGIVIRPDEPRFRVHDRIVNRSGEPATVQLLYHINVGPPLLGPGSTLVAPVSEVVPRDQASSRSVSEWHDCGAPASQDDELAYFCRLSGDAAGRTSVLLRDPSCRNGMTVSFNVSDLPCFTFWKNLRDERDGYVVGVEPATNYPNPRSFEETNGRVLTVAPGDAADFELTITAHRTAESVLSAEAAIAELSDGDPILHETTIPRYCYEGYGPATSTTGVDR